MSPLRKEFWCVAGAIIAFAVLLSFAEIVRIGFEPQAGARWIGPIGGGANGGRGGGKQVGIQEGDYVHGGQHAIRLEVWDDGTSSNAIAWAAVIHQMPLHKGSRIHAEGWVYFSSTNHPLSANASVHLQLEFFRDAGAEDLMPEYVCVSQPVTPTTHEHDHWHRIALSGRVPSEARSLRAGIIVTNQRLGRKKQAVWIDDLSVYLNVSGDLMEDAKHRDLLTSWDQLKVVALCAETGYKGSR